jgi:predicted GNAT family acetyltransferase
MDVKVQHNEKERKFYANVEGQEAAIQYAMLGDDTYNLLHTFVPEELRGRGVGEKLVQGTLDEIRREGAQFLPSCAFVQGFLKKHKEYQQGTAR